MVDFRFHLVSIVAIFLALAIGIVLGTNVLSGDVLDNLKHQTSDLRNEAQVLRDKASDQANRLAQQQGFTDTIEPTIVSHRLDGQRVVLITSPGVPGSIGVNVSHTLELAGAKVTGTIALQSAYFAADQRDLLDAVTRSLGLAVVNVPDGAGTFQRVALQLAGALVTPPNSLRMPSMQLNPGAAALLAGLENDDFLKLSDAPSVMSTMAVVLVPAAPDKPTDADTESGRALVTLADSLQHASGGAVMAGADGSAATGGAVAVLRNSGAVGAVSGIDDADGSQGRIALVLALQGALTGTTGQYGVGPGARAASPTPPHRPTPTATPVLPEVPGTLTTPRPTASPNAGSKAEARGTPARSGAGL